METVVNLPMLTRSQATSPRGGTPPTLPPISLPMPPKMQHLDEDTSPSAPYRRVMRRYGTAAFLVVVTISTFVVLRLASFNLVPPVDPITATPFPTSTPAAAEATRSSRVTPAPSATQGSVVVTATPFRIDISPGTPASNPVTVTPRDVSGAPTFNSPYKVIIKGIDRPSNVRSAPDTRAEVLTQMYLDDTATVIARTGDLSAAEQTWYLVVTSQGITGWVRGDVVELLPIGSNPINVPTAATAPIIPSLVPSRTPIGATPR
jgi:hypothetical protein